MYQPAAIGNTKAVAGHRFMDEVKGQEHEGRFAVVTRDSRVTQPANS